MNLIHSKMLHPGKGTVIILHAAYFRKKNLCDNSTFCAEISNPSRYSSHKKKRDKICFVPGKHPVTVLKRGTSMDFNARRH